jgi:hypothetical protein
VEGDRVEAIGNRQDQLHSEYKLTRKTKMDSKGKLLDCRLTNQDSSVREVHNHRNNQRKISAHVSNSSQEFSD